MTHDKRMTALCFQISLGFLLVGTYSSVSAAQPATNSPVQANSPQAEMEAAIHQVEKIVNQPVGAYRRAPGMHVSEYSPGWFHEGATKPYFNRSMSVRRRKLLMIRNPYIGGGAILLLGLLLLSKYLLKAR